VARRVLGAHHRCEPVGDAQLRQRRLDQVTQAPGGDGQRPFGPVAARDLHHGCDGQHTTAEAGHVQLFLFPGDVERVQGQPGRGHQLGRDLGGGNAAHPVELVLGERQAITAATRVQAW